MKYTVTVFVGGAIDIRNVEAGSPEEAGRLVADLNLRDLKLRDLDSLSVDLDVSTRRDKEVCA
jgi:hypothetical protein